MEVRFKERSKSPSKLTQAALNYAGPGTYDTVSHWPGKHDKKGGEKGKKKYDQIVSPRIDLKENIYYDE